MRPWSDLPVPSVAIRKKNVLAVLTRKERARSSTKLQVAVSRAHQVARAPEDFRRGAREPSWTAI